VRVGIQGDPALASLFQHSACLRVQPAALVALCAQIIVDEEVDYHNNAELPDEVVKAIEKVRGRCGIGRWSDAHHTHNVRRMALQVDTRVKMERLLERIEACLPDLKAKLTPATDEELSAVKKKFCLWFPPGHRTSSLCFLLYCFNRRTRIFGLLTWTCHALELEAFFKWSNGVPREAPGMIRFINCASLAEIDEEFHYSEFFPHLFRRYATYQYSFDCCSVISSLTLSIPE
jgi:hypothetical protein